jgi:PAS domain S-box-containing protein
MRFLFVLLGLVMLWEAEGQSYSFSQYEVEDGLVQSSVHCFLQDHFGNLWVGTSAGLSRFDGQHFKNYSQQQGLVGNHINDLYQRGDFLLIATRQGLSIFDGRTFRNYQLQDSAEQALAVNQIIEDQQNSICLILDQDRLAHFDGQQIHYLEAGRLAGSFSGAARGQEGQLWLATYSGHIYQLHDSVLYPVAGGQPLSYRIRDIYIDRQNRSWVITPQEILRYKPKRYQLCNPGQNFPRFGQAFGIPQDAEGMLWVATSNGTFCFDPETLQADPKSIALPGSLIRSIYRGQEDKLWFGTFGDGFFKFKGRLITKLKKEEGLRGKTFMSLFKDSRDRYWFGSYGGGLSSMKDGVITHFGEQQGLNSNFVSSFTEGSDGKLWVGTMNGLNVYDEFTFRHFNAKEGLPSNAVYRAPFTPENDLLVCTSGGVVLYQNERFLPISDYAGNHFKELILSVRRWGQDRILLMSEKYLYVLKDGKVKDFLSSDTFDYQSLTAIEWDRHGKLWISTLQGGSYDYDSASGEIHSINELYELSSMMIFANDGSLILGTQKGLTRLFFYENGGLWRLQNYRKSDGLLGVEADANATYRDDDESLWFGTVNGIYRFHPVYEKKQPDEVIPHLTGLKLFYENVNWATMADSVSSWYQIPQNLHLSHQRNHLIFSFMTNQLNKPEQILYSFMLDGYEENWSPATNRNEAVYPNPPSGDYTFKVGAKRPRGTWSTTPLTYTFYIEPPFWQTWWFYLLSFLLALLLIRLYVYWNLKREREQRVQLELEVKGRTREIQALNNSLEKRVQARTQELELTNKKFEVEFELRKMDQDKLARREREYRQLVNNLREVIFKTDTLGQFTFFNDRWQEYMGYSARESIGQHFTTYLKNTEVQKLHFAKIFDAINSKELPYFEAEVRMQRKDGMSFWAKVSTRIEYDDEGEVIGINGSLVDIDMRKKAEFALRASEDRYKFLIENTQDVITLQSPDLIYFYASPRIYEVAGHEPEEMVGRSSLDYLHPDDIATYMQLKKEVVASRKSKGIVLRFRNGQGEYRWYETFLKPILDENDALQSYISSCRDVTEKVELSKEIDKVRKKVAQDFHDEMGNNLASISVLSQLIQNKLGSAGQEVEALLNKIDTASKNLFSGTRDFIWAIDPKNDNLKEVYYNLKDFGEELFDNTGISLYASFDEAEEDAALQLPSGWSRQLVLIFKEAFTNALKYSEAGSVYIYFKVKSGSFLVEVSDDGKGFPKDQLQSLRGIKNMRERAAKLKARLEIETRPGQGSKVRLKQKITQKRLVNVKAKY